MTKKKRTAAYLEEQLKAANARARKEKAAREAYEKGMQEGIRIAKEAKN